MKRKSIIILMVSILLISLMSCATTGIYDSAEKTRFNDNNISVKVNGVIEKHTFMIYGFSLVSNKGVSLTIKNISDSPITINWEKSSITYGNNTSSVFIDGQKAITANTSSMPPLTIPSQKSVSVKIYPSKNVKFNSNKMEWEIEKMGLSKGENLIIVLNYEYKNKDYFIEVKAAPKNGFIKLGF